MPQLAIRNPPHQIAQSAVDEIKKLHASILSFALQSKEYAIRIGEILTSIRVVRDGKWSKWVEDNLPFGIRQAQRYLSIYDRREEIRRDVNVALGEPTIVSQIMGNSSNRQQLHESNFWTLNIKRGQSWLGCINHELKDHPIETWRKDQLISMAATVEPFAELYNKLKTLIG